MGCGASAPIREEKSPLDVDRTPSARLRGERSMSASVRGETAVTLEGYEFEGTLGYALHEERQTQFRNRTPREKLSKRGSLRGGFAGNSPLVRGDGKEESPQLEKAPSETISELATLQSENATPPPV